jgi:hypothetical protein
MASAGGAESIGANVRGLLTGAERLARAEMELALARGRESFGESAKTFAMVVVAGVFALGGISFLLHAIYSGLLLRVDQWLAALLTAVIAFAGAGLFLRLGASKPAHAERKEALEGRRDGVVTMR